MKSQIRGLLLWASALIEGCSWQERQTEPSNGAGISLRTIYTQDVLLNYVRDIPSVDQKIRFPSGIPWRRFNWGALDLNV